MTEILQPRLLSRAEAAAYCGFKPSAFSAHVSAGRLPGPLAGLKKWDRAAIDAYLDKISGINTPMPAVEEDDPWAEYDRKKNARGGG